MTGILDKANGFLASCLLLVTVLGSPIAAQAAKVASSVPSRPRVSARLEPNWHVLETANFRLLSYSTRRVEASTGQACEALRTELYAKWAGDTAPSPGHPSAKSCCIPTMPAT